MRPLEEGRHAVSKIRRAVSMKITVVDSKRGNTAVMTPLFQQQCVNARETEGRIYWIDKVSQSFGNN